MKFQTGQKVIVKEKSSTYYDQIGIVDAYPIETGWSDLYDVTINGKVIPFFEDELELFQNDPSI